MSNNDNPYELVRVRDGQVERTTTRAAAESAGLSVLDKKAVDDAGRVLDPLRVERADYDPSGYKADEVLEYLGSVDADEAARVLEAESAGKNRTTITSWTAPSGAGENPEA